MSPPARTLPVARRAALLRRGTAVFAAAVASVVAVVAAVASPAGTAAARGDAPVTVGTVGASEHHRSSGLEPPSTPPDPAASWSWPVADARVVKRAFEAPAHEFGPGHRGLDIGAGPGAPVVSPAPGVVLFAGPVAGRSVLTIDHGDGIVSSYDPVLPAVEAGARIGVGQIIGSLEGGEAMHCDEGCLHLGVRRDGAYVDPLSFFRPPRRSVLLPVGP